MAHQLVNSLVEIMNNIGDSRKIEEPSLRYPVEAALRVRRSQAAQARGLAAVDTIDRNLPKTNCFAIFATPKCCFLPSIEVSRGILSRGNRKERIPYSGAILADEAMDGRHGLKWGMGPSI